jgi:hypothetical protein
MKLTKNYLRKLVVESLDEMGSYEMEEDHIPGGNSVYVVLFADGGIDGVFSTEEKARAQIEEAQGDMYIQEWQIDNPQGSKTIEHSRYSGEEF